MNRYYFLRDAVTGDIYADGILPSSDEEAVEHLAHELRRLKYEGYTNIVTLAINNTARLYDLQEIC